MGSLCSSYTGITSLIFYIPNDCQNIKVDSLASILLGISNRHEGCRVWGGGIFKYR